MKLADFDFDLPSELIAQVPARHRDQSRLILPDENNKIIEFAEIIDYLHQGDVMVFNDSKVIKAKLTLDKQGKKININLNKPISPFIWRAFARPAKKIDIGDEFFFDNHKLIISNKLGFGEIEITFVLSDADIFKFLDQYGEIPLPLYIKRDGSRLNLGLTDDQERYQNIYARVPGSVAAPTAGLHFTERLMQNVRDKGIEVHFVTLHVGAGTFLPVKTENIFDHKMHSEYCHISEYAAGAINRAKAERRRIIAVGTTVMRSLESFGHQGKLAYGTRETNIFITPPYDFQIADSLITNFHLPKSTLFMLVCAFYGIKKTKALYKYAIDNKMRFFSYGDAMFLNKNP